MPHSDADKTIEDLIREAVRVAVAATHTFELGKVVAFDDTGLPPRADIQLAVKGRRMVDGVWEQYERGILPDVPVGYPKAGAASMYWPLAAGDEVLVLYADRDMDAAIENGEDVNDVPTPRRHSVNDAVAVPFAWSSKGSVPLAARDSATVIEDALILLGQGATEWATTAEKVLTRLSAIENWCGTHDHIGVTPGVGTSGTPTAGPTFTVIGDLKADKVKVE